MKVLRASRIGTRAECERAIALGMIWDGHPDDPGDGRREATVESGRAGLASGLRRGAAMKVLPMHRPMARRAKVLNVDPVLSLVPVVVVSVELRP